MRIILALLLATSYAAPLSDDPIPVGSRKQLFIDRKFIQSDTGVALRMNPPVKAGAALTADRPWEQGWLTGSGYVSEDGGRYRMWCIPPSPVEYRRGLYVRSGKDAVTSVVGSV